MKKNLIAVIAFLFAANGIFAKNINFQIVQNNPGTEEVFVTSYLFEQAMVDFFFESGHIVSNSPAIIYSDETGDKDELKKALVETTIGSMDILVRVFVNYDQVNAKNPKVFLLELVKSVSWKSYSGSTGKLISEGSLLPGPIDSTNNNESGIYNFASLAASKVSAGLKNAK